MELGLAGGTALIRSAGEGLGSSIDATPAAEGAAAATADLHEAAAIPMGHYGKPQVCADVVAFLASPLASYLTGSQIRLAGGYIPSI